MTKIEANLAPPLGGRFPLSGGNGRRPKGVGMLSFASQMTEGEIVGADIIRPPEIRADNVRPYEKTNYILHFALRILHSPTYGGNYV